MNYEKEARISLERIKPRLDRRIPHADERAIFYQRMDEHFTIVFHRLHDLYGQRYDFFYHLEQVMTTAAEMYAARAPDLKEFDLRREQHPDWFLSERTMGGLCYVDLFAGTLHGLQDKIPYFKELGLTYLHLLPLFKSPAGDNDGGYAVTSYRDVDPALGTTDTLRTLATALRESGISVVLDFVFNHTADNHAWALKALAGEERYQDFYLMFPDRSLPDQYERTLREIFPEQAPGNFTYREEIDRWVWTTFHHYQWDLNYANPEVFNHMVGEMLFIANLGAEVLRLDAIAFAWKQMGTACEGLPQVHMLVQAFNALVKIVAPAMVFKSEAIVHPTEVAQYIRLEEAPISYNPTFMALLWESLATREVKLLTRSMQEQFTLNEGCSWVNYVRCHDDIGWTFADETAGELGINGYDHRQFLNAFYTGRFEGSFAAGLPFNYNPITHDMRISGMCASLAGLERALDAGNDLFIEHAIRRIILIHAMIISAGGIPLIYLGDEITMLNDYNYKYDPDRDDDSRWAHRVAFDWERAAQRNNRQTIVGRVYQALQHMIAVRKQTPAFAGNSTTFVDTGSPHVFGFIRQKRVLVLGNFSEFERTVTPPWMPSGPVDLISGKLYDATQPVTLEPYRFVWLAQQRGDDISQTYQNH